MRYYLRTKIFLSLIVFLGVFVFVNNSFANINITGPNVTSSNQLPHNGNATITSGTISISSGTISSPNISGVDNGNLTLTSGSLQLNRYSVFVINPGNQIINQGGNIISDSDTQIVHGYLWAKDFDVDGCFIGPVKYNNSATTANTEWGSGYRRVKNLSYTEPTTADDSIYGPPPGCTATLNVTLSASPSSGTAPLSGVDLTATVGGTATGSITYRFDCTSDGYYESNNTVTINPFTPFTKADICTYTSAGTYTAKVEVTRGGLTATGTAVITVNAAPTLNVTLSASPSSGTAPLPGVDLTATVGGTATGSITYRFDCASDGYDTTDTVTTNPFTKADICTYTSAGTYTAKVEVTRGGLTATGTAVITVNAAPFDYSLSATTPASVTKPTSGSVTTSSTITATLLSGTTQTVGFTVSGLPTGITASTLNSCSLTCSNQTLTFTVGTTVSLGTYTITVTGTASGGLVKTKTITLRVCQCTSGVCCDGCNFSPTTSNCDTLQQWRCSPSGCGGNSQVRYATKYCSGTSATCSGSTGPWGSYVTEFECDDDMMCDPSGGCYSDDSCECNCTSWQNSFCNWSSGCMYQTRTCTPSGCDITSRCNPSSSCTCSNDCSPSGVKDCFLGNLRTCGNYDSDPCLELRVTTYAYYGSCGGVCSPKLICTKKQRPYYECVEGAMKCIYCAGRYDCP